MDFTGLTKLLVCLSAMGAAVYLGAVGVLQSESVVGIISASLGYVFGNGHGILAAGRAGGAAATRQAATLTAGGRPHG